MKVILNLKQSSDGILALRAVNTHRKERPDWGSCIYSYADGSSIFVRLNTASISAFEKGYNER